MRGEPGPRRGAAMSRLNIIGDGALLIDDGVIKEVGPTRRIENLAAVRTAREICAAGRVVMPGFVDSHTHLISGPSLAGAGNEICTPRDARMILGSVAAVRESTSRRLASEARAVLRDCLAHGTTTLEAKSGFGLNAGAELKILRVLTALGDAPMTVVPTLSAASATPAEFDGRPDDYMRWLTAEFLPVVHRRGLARFVDGSCDQGAFSAAQLHHLYRAASDLGLPLKMNLAQFAPADGASLASEFAFTSFDHLDHVDDSGIAEIARSGAVATLTPAAAFFLGHNHAPARKLIARGVPVALASDSSRVTSPTFNMQIILFLACHQLGMTPAEALSAATINGAHALRLGHRAGSLEAGKQADIAILKCGDYRELARNFGGNLVEMTIRHGEVVASRSGVKWNAA